MRGTIAAIVLLSAGFGAGIAATPKALDPVHVAPHIYELALENERVRVLKRIARNGETTPLVSQPDRVVIYLNPCAWMEPDSGDGERMQSFRFGEPTWVEANTHGGETSNVIQTCHILEVELK